MFTQPQGFRAETVDEQIDQLAFSDRAQRTTSEACVVQDLQELYTQTDSPEQVRRSLDTIWSRLSDRLSPENQTLFSLPDQAESANESAARSALTLIAGQADHDEPAGRARLSEKQMAPLPTRPAKAKKRASRSTLTLSVLAAVVLLGMFSWVMVSHLTSRNSTSLGSSRSGPGISATATVVPTPAPQSLQDQAHQLLNQYHKEVSSWGETHLYFDRQDDKKYAIDYAYAQQGAGGWLDKMVSQAQSSADFQSAIDQIQTELTNLHAMEMDFSDPTPWNQAHKADGILLNHYKLTSGLVIVVSLAGQSMRVYQNGQLLKAFLVTTGQFEEPTLPGSWQVEARQTSTTLKSTYPRSSPYWFPDTRVNYLLQFHSGGYLIYDAWWRSDFGPGTQFAHKDAGGDPFSNNGSNGTINLSESDMKTLYNLAQINTPVIVY